MSRNTLILLFSMILPFSSQAAEIVTYLAGKGTMEHLGKTTSFRLIMKSFSKETGMIQFVHRYLEENFTGVMMSVEMKKSASGGWELHTSTPLEPRAVIPVTIVGPASDPKSFSGATKRPDGSVVELSYRHEGKTATMKIFDKDKSGKIIRSFLTESTEIDSASYEKLKAKFKVYKKR